MYKKAFSVFSAILIMLSACVTATAYEDLALSAKSAVLIVADTGEIVYAENENQKLPMASTTKIMTSLLALEYGNSAKEIIVTDEMLKVEGTSMGLLPGDSVTLGTLVSGMLLESGNDAANVTAYAVSGGVEPFLELMNSRAKELGMNNTSFDTPSGLDSENHYSTAYDMAILGAYAVSNPQFLSICSQKQQAVYYGNPPYRRTLTNHNKLLSMYDGCIGIKTGFTKKSGRCLVTAARRDNITLVAVTLNAGDDWNDHKKMFNYGFSRVKNQNLPDDVSFAKLNVVGGEKSEIGIKLSFTPYLPSANENKDISLKLLLSKFEYAPVAEGKVVGTVYYYSGEKLIAEVPVVTQEEAAMLPATVVKESFFEKIKNFFRKNFGEKYD